MEPMQSNCILIAYIFVFSNILYNYVILPLCIVGLMNFSAMSMITSSPSVETAVVSSMRNNAAGDLMSGKAFDNGCICQQPENYADMLDSLLRGDRQRSCMCCASQLQPEIEFVNALMNIGIKLGALDTKEQKSESPRPIIVFRQYFNCSLNSIKLSFLFESVVSRSS